MKKYLIFLMMLVIGMFLIAGCGAQTKDADQAPVAQEEQGQENSGEVASAGDAALEYLQTQVPEMGDYAQLIETYNQENGTNNKMIVMINAEPDPGAESIYQQEYYDVYVGEDLGDHTSRWTSFLIRQDLSEILVDDALTGEYISLEEWRSQQ